MRVEWKLRRNMKEKEEMEGNRRESGDRGNEERG